VSLVVIGIGLGYDLRLKGTAWSWLPFAVGIPLLPVSGWLAARGELAPAFGILLPAAVAAGAALAIGNSLVDVERDRAAGRTSVASALGPVRAVRIGVGLYLVVAVAATVSLASARSVPVVALVVLAGLGLVPALAAAVGADRPDRRELAWRIEAVGIAALALAWTALVLL
jgi:4-hydroxybenzoate polyprenyltransferase